MTSEPGSRVARRVPRLWLVTDGARGTGGRDLAQVIAAAHAGGVEAVLIREVGARTQRLIELVAELSRPRSRGLRVFLSRRLDLVRALGLDGVHLARDAVAVGRARTWLGPGALIGYSAHDADEAARVANEGADYVTLSPIFATASKPGAPGRGVRWLRSVVGHLPVPALALGGVTAPKTKEMLLAGAWGVAAVSAIGAAPDVEVAARSFRDQIAMQLGENAG